MTLRHTFLNRPKLLNPLDAQTLRELAAALRDVAEDSRAVILTGAGEKAFVAGADIAAMAPMTPSAAREFSQLGHSVTALLEDVPCATIAAVTLAAMPRSRILNILGLGSKAQTCFASRARA